MHLVAAGPEDFQLLPRGPGHEKDVHIGDLLHGLAPVSTRYPAEETAILPNLHGGGSVIGIPTPTGRASAFAGGNPLDQGGDADPVLFDLRPQDMAEPL